ncbi:hypothetical protein AcW1_010066 [Taiwanofungus camphoratus]|nr:hypothetical protein AcW1_010066 [Antrodia cinnamomea]
MLASALLRRNAPQGVRSALRIPRRYTSTATGSSSPSSFFRYFRLFSAATTLAVTSYAIGSLYPPTLATYISPRSAPPPLHPDDPSCIAYTATLEESLQKLPVLTALRAREDAQEWYEARPYQNVPEERRANSFTGGTLKGPGKLALSPLIRARKDDSESWNFVHVGRGVCGHEGIVHGGLLATMLDESLGRTALLNLPDKIGVTAYLHLNYRAPTRADQFLVVKTRLVEAKGRKSKVAGSIEDMQGNVLVEAEALFIQPRYAKLLDNRRMREMLGEPADSKEPIVEGVVAPVPVGLPGVTPAMGEAKP